MLRRITLITVFGFLFSLFASSALAQDCDAASLSSDLAEFSAEMDSSGSVSSVLDDVAAWLAERQEACADIVEATETPSESEAPKEPVLSFSREAEGNQPVLGPLTIPEGIYRVRLETAGTFIADVNLVTHGCYVMGGSGQFAEISSGLSREPVEPKPFNLFNVSIGKATNGNEILLAGGCEAFITISNIIEDWTLEFYNVGDTTEVKTEYSSETNGTMPVLGPLKFRDGNYKLTLKTDGYFVAEIEALSGTCESNDSSGFLIQMLQKGVSETAKLLTTKDCVGFISIKDAIEPWTLTFEPIE